MAERLNEPLLVNTGDVDNPVPLSKAILDGYAPNDELYSFAQLPTLSAEFLTGLVDADYPTVFYSVSKLLMGEAVPDELLQQVAQDAYSTDNFDLDETDNNLRITRLPSGIHVVGLSDGPTGAFKDMAMQPFARWMSYLQQEEGELLSILLSTSGDTGPAALKAFGGLPSIEMTCMFANTGVSTFQRAQMAESSGQPGVHVLEVDGDFSFINDIHMDATNEFDLSTVNSVNIARIIAQIPYYVASYLKTIAMAGGNIGDPIDVSIPSGNFGNGLSAILARKMGVPIREIFIATNENNTLDRIFGENTFSLRDLIPTDSSAQDVRNPSNVWRYLFMLYGNDPSINPRIHSQLFGDEQSVDLSQFQIADQSLRDGITSVTVTSEFRDYAVKSVFEETGGYGGDGKIIDPHTANAVAGVNLARRPDSKVPILVFETAKPFKFNEYIMRILGINPPRPVRFSGLEQKYKNTKMVQIADSDQLIEYLRDHTMAVEKAA